MNEIKKIVAHINSYIELLITNINFDRQSPKVLENIKRLLDQTQVKEINIKATMPNRALISKYVYYESAMGGIKGILAKLNEHNVNNYDKFSSLTQNVILDMRSRLSKINSLYAALKNIMDKEFQEDIVVIREKFNKADVEEYVKSYNVILDISKTLELEEIERVKDIVIKKNDYVRTNIIKSSFDLNSHKIDLSFFGLSDPTLTQDYFQRLANEFLTTVIVIDLSKKNQYIYTLITEISGEINDESVLANQNISIPKTIVPNDLENELTYFEPNSKPSNNVSSGDNSSSNDEKLLNKDLSSFDGVLLKDEISSNKSLFIVLKLIGPEVFVMSKKKPLGPEDVKVKLMESDRVESYNKILEEEFLKRDVIKKPKLINLPEFISIKQLIYKIKVRAKDLAQGPQISAIMEEVRKQIAELFELKVYEYISQYENLGTMLENAYKKKGATLESVLDEVFQTNRNIFAELRDSFINED